MKKKLHRVRIVLYVMAEDSYDACYVATQAHFDVFECVAIEAKTLDPGWGDAVPYNSDDDRTCSEIFTSKMQGDLPDAKSINTPRHRAVNTTTPSIGVSVN